MPTPLGNCCVPRHHLTNCHATKQHTKSQWEAEKKKQYALEIQRELCGDHARIIANWNGGIVCMSISAHTLWRSARQYSMVRHNWTASICTTHTQTRIDTYTMRASTNNDNNYVWQRRILPNHIVCSMLCCYVSIWLYRVLCTRHSTNRLDNTCDRKGKNHKWRDPSTCTLRSLSPARDNGIRCQWSRPSLYDRSMSSSSQTHHELCPTHKPALSGNKHNSAKT